MQGTPVGHIHCTSVYQYIILQKKAEEQNSSAGTCTHSLLSVQDLTNLLAWPIANPALTNEIFDIVQQASHYFQLKKVPMKSPRP